MFHRKSEPDSYRAPERLNCITDASHGSAVNGLFCVACDRAILAVVQRDSQPLRTSVNTPPQPPSPS